MREILILAATMAALATTPALARAPDFTAFDKAVKAKCAVGDFGGVITVAVGGKPVYSHSCGMTYPADARFKLLGASKPLTALVVMRLVEQGRMSLDAPIADYVPDIPPNWRAVTVRELLNHTSGLHDHTDELPDVYRADHASAVRKLLKQWDIRRTSPRKAPGTGWRYNSFGYELLAEAAVRTGGESFDRLLARLVFQPAGMTAVVETGRRDGKRFISTPDPKLVAGWNLEARGRQKADSPDFLRLGSGAVHASVADLLALDRALAAGRIVKPETWKRMIGNPTPLSASNPGAYYGLGFMVGDRMGLPSHGHTGGFDGYVSTFRRFPSKDAVVIGLSNGGWAGTRWIEEGAAEALAGS